MVIPLAEFAANEAAHPRSKDDRGSVFQRERIAVIADRCCSRQIGDLIEIGCYAGGTSQILADVARKYGRKLVCVDNWREGTEYNLREIRQGFLQVMAEWSDVLILIDGDAHLPEIIAAIQERRYCFAFSDDGHAYEDHLSELETLLPLMNGVIAVDDVYLPDVRRAIADAILGTEWAELYDERLRESWVVRR